MGFNYTTSSIFLLLLSSVLLLNAAFAYFLYKRAKKYNSVLSGIASFIFAAESIGICMIIILSRFNTNAPEFFNNLIQPKLLVLGFPTLFIFVAYYIELIHPGWLNWRRLIQYSIPAAILCILMFVIPKEFTELHSFKEIGQNIGRTDVIIRLIVALSYVIYVHSAVFFIKRNEKESLVPKKICLIFKAIMLVIPFTFHFGMNLGVFTVTIVHFFLIISLNILILIVEFKIRIPVILKDLPSEAPSKNKGGHKYFDNPQIYMNPDMTAGELAGIMGTNQKYLANEIKKEGFASYTDMINSKRVKYICRMLEKKNSGERPDIVQLMFEAGFRSRSTASAEFKRIVGKTPSEYVKDLV